MIFAKFRSLKISMLYAMIVALILAFGTFIGLRTVLMAYIDNRYLSAESRLEREERYYEELQEYVDDGHLTSDDTEKLAEWVHSNRYLYVMIYKDDQLLLDSGSADGILNPDKENEDGEKDPENGENGTDTDPDNNENAGGEQSGTDTDPDKDDFPNSGLTVTFPTKEDLIAYAEAKGTYPIEMADGTPILVSIVDYTEYLYYDISNVASLAIAVVMLVAVIMIYFAGITGRITKLGRKVSKVTSGNMDYSITDGMKVGNDEIYKLAYNVENMRCSMLERISKEREAIASNNELITSMSHDIRTPLTVLLGYIDVMKMHSQDETMHDYLGAAEHTTLRLKEMTDDMFNYFLVFGGEDKVADIEEYDLYTLFEQILSESGTLMREKGYDVREETNASEIMIQSRPTILTDPPKLMRIFENVLSNVMKYADKSMPVSISVNLDDDKTNIKIVNTILRETEKVESNRIGLKTCRKLAEMIGASFEAQAEGDKFTVSITLKNGGKKGE